MSQQLKEEWNRLIEIYFETKRLMLKVEEYDSGHEFFYPPLVQFRDALDHIMRLKLSKYDGRIWQEDPDLEFGENHKLTPEEYEEKQIDKAIGHMYRAFFDVADWMSIVLREEIRDAIGMYNPEVISQVFPEYYECVKPQLEEINTLIVDVRMNKDIGKKLALIKGVKDYLSILDTLESHRNMVLCKIPELSQKLSSEVINE